MVMPRLLIPTLLVGGVEGGAGVSRSAADEIEDLLRSVGFTQVRTETLRLSPPVVCVLAASPGPSA
jgi:hypothetical protein